MPLTSVREIGLVFLAIALAPVAAGARDWRTWPFSPTSPWNHPIGSWARYADVPGHTSVPADLNHDERWTSSIVIARPTDPFARVLFAPSVGPSSTWTFVARGGQVCGNPRETELALAAEASPTLRWQANYYSTVAAPNTSRHVLPPDFHRASADWHPVFRMPAGACPSPDTDGYLAVFQPDGWVLDVYAAVVLSDNRVLGTVASYVDARPTAPGGGTAGARACCRRSPA